MSNGNGNGAEKTGARPAQLKQIQPTAGKDFKVKLLPKNVHQPITTFDKPPWNGDVRIRPTSNRFEKTVVCKTYDVEVPCPDYTCFKGTRYLLEGDKATPDGDVVIMRKNYKPAVWCDPVRRVRQVRHCTETCLGNVREYDTPLATNFQSLYIDENAPRQQIKNISQGCHPIYVPVNQQNGDGEPKTAKKIFYENTKAVLDAEAERSRGQALRMIGGHELLQ